MFAVALALGEGSEGGFLSLPAAITFDDEFEGGGLQAVDGGLGPDWGRGRSCSWIASITCGFRELQTLVSCGHFGLSGCVWSPRKKSACRLCQPSVPVSCDCY